MLASACLKSTDTSEPGSSRRETRAPEQIPQPETSVSPPGDQVDELVNSAMTSGEPARFLATITEGNTSHDVLSRTHVDLTAVNSSKGSFKWLSYVQSADIRSNSNDFLTRAALQALGFVESALKTHETDLMIRATVISALRQYEKLIGSFVREVKEHVYRHSSGDDILKDGQHGDAPASRSGAMLVHMRTFISSLIWLVSHAMSIAERASTERLWYLDQLRTFVSDGEASKEGTEALHSAANLESFS